MLGAVACCLIRKLSKCACIPMEHVTFQAFIPLNLAGKKANSTNEQN